MQVCGSPRYVQKPHPSLGMNAQDSAGNDQDPVSTGDLGRLALYMDATEFRRDACSSYGLNVTLLTFSKKHSYQINSHTTKYVGTWSYHQAPASL